MRRRLTHTQRQALALRLELIDQAPTAEAEHEHLRAIVQIAQSLLPGARPDPAHHVLRRVVLTLAADHDLASPGLTSLLRTTREALVAEGALVLALDRYLLSIDADVVTMSWREHLDELGPAAEAEADPIGHLLQVLDAARARGLSLRDDVRHHQLEDQG